MLSEMYLVKLDLLDFESLQNFLKRHEQDIAMGINDFSDLAELFEAVMKRSPLEINTNL